MYRGIYASPDCVKPNRDRVDCNKKEVEVQKLWLIEFLINNGGKGIAVVKAPTVGKAEDLLKSQGLFNGIPNSYNITRIEEIQMTPMSSLLCESILSYE